MRSRTARPFAVALIALAAVSIALPAAGQESTATAQESPATAEDPPAGIPEEKIGLAQGSVFEVLVPDAVEPEAGDPGDRPAEPPAYEGSPPVVPHGVDDFLPIGREDNLCVDCHAIAEAGEGDPTPIPADHYTDFRRAPDKVGESVAGARWVCISCHAVPTSARPLVDNRFGPVSAEAEAQR